MYDFEVKVKVPFLYEITYEETIKDFDQHVAVDRKVTKTERFVEWSKLRSFAYDLKGKKILQVTEIKDMTSALRNDMTTQGKD
jgi:hypothetical protein